MLALFQGVIDTELGRHMQEKWYFRMIYPVMRVFIKTPLQGAQTQLYCCLEESIADHSGRYVQFCEFTQPITNFFVPPLMGIQGDLSGQ